MRIINLIYLHAIFTYLNSWHIVIEEAKINALISNNDVKGKIQCILIELSEKGIVSACSTIAERLRIHPCFECERCKSHVEKRWSKDRHCLTCWSIQINARTSSIVAWRLKSWCVVAIAIEIIIQILQIAVETPKNSNSWNKKKGKNRSWGWRADTNVFDIVHHPIQLYYLYVKKLLKNNRSVVFL